MIVLIAVIVTVHVAVYVTTKSIIEKDITQSAKGIAVAVAEYVMDDIDEYKSFVAEIEEHRPFDEKIGLPVEHYRDSAYHQKMQAFFAKIKENSGVKYIYADQRIDAEKVEFILDAEPIGTEFHSPPGSIDENSPWREDCYLHKKPVGYPPGEYSEWGELLGAFAPILDNDEEKTLLGTVGVDIDVSHIYRHLHFLQKIMFAVYVFILGTVFLILKRYSGTILDPLLKDKLTGAYNKRYCEKLLQEEIANALKGHRDLAVFMLDLDHFKNVNDTYGHGFGDKVLSSVSAVIRNSLRHNDHFVRYGGEEFVVIIPNAGENRAVEIAERMRRAIEENEIHNDDKDIQFKITISIGVALLNHCDISPQQFVEKADKALYEAKKTRNCCSVFK
jgi:diguanylate cyclase (GGDEF)-like protein